MSKHGLYNDIESIQSELRIAADLVDDLGEAIYARLVRDFAEFDPETASTDALGCLEQFQFHLKLDEPGEFVDLDQAELQLDEGPQ